MDPNARGRSPSARNPSQLRHTPSASPHPHPPYNQSFADTNLLSADSFTGLNNTAHSAHFADPSFTQDFQHQPDYFLGQYNGFQAQQQPPNLSSHNSDVSNHTFLQSANGGDNSFGFNQPAQPGNLAVDEVHLDAQETELDDECAQEGRLAASGAAAAK